MRVGRGIHMGVTGGGWLRNGGVRFLAALEMTCGGFDGDSSIKTETALRGGLDPTAEEVGVVHTFCHWPC